VDEQAVRISFPGTNQSFLHRVRSVLESILPKIHIINVDLSLGIKLPWHGVDIHVHLLLQPRISGVVVLSRW
jgi:hypothetical protein